MTISDFLETLDSHGIYTADDLAADFTEQTGFAPCWPTQTHRETAVAMANRGLGGELGPPNGQRLAHGYAVAVALADKYGTHKNYRSKHGRGSQFREAVDSLRKAGK